jgi:GNAT superfamily N-acetyltransferase
MKPIHPSLEGLTEDEFLTGSDPEGDLELDIDWRYGKEWNKLLREMKQFDPNGLQVEVGAHETVSAIAPGYRFRPVESGVLLIDPTGEAVGGYLSCDVSIDPAHQGQGLGAELIVERYLRGGSLPTWWLDTPQYTGEGERAHRSAYQLFLNRPDLIDAKIAVIDGEFLSASERNGKLTTIEVDGMRRPTHDSMGRPLGCGDVEKQKAFWSWAGDTKAVDDSGSPLLLFHGSIVRDSERVPGMGDIKEFDRLFTTKFRAHSIDTVGSWFSTNPSVNGAQMYSGTNNGAVIYPVYVSIKNPQETTFHLLLRRARLLANGVDDGRVVGKLEVDAYRKWLKETGKDGIKIVHDEYSDNRSTEFKEQTAWIALEPDQIKSATGNPGTYLTNCACIADGHGPKLGHKIEFNNEANNNNEGDLESKRRYRP